MTDRRPKKVLAVYAMRTTIGELSGGMLYEHRCRRMSESLFFGAGR